jgi:hypothetical protein
VNGGGILVKPGALGSVNGSLDGVRLGRNTFGIRVEDRSTITARNSIAAGNTNNGFLAASAGTGSAILNLESCVASSNINGTNNVVGVHSSGSLALVRISNVMSVSNNVGLQSAGGGAIISFGNNRVGGNTAADGAPTLTPGQV